MKKITRVNVSLDTERAGKLARLHSGSLANTCRMILEAAAMTETEDFYSMLAILAQFKDKDR